MLGGHSERLLRHRVHGEHHVYDPRTDDWQEAPPLPTHRAGAMAVRVGHLLYVVGGHGGARSHVHAEHEAYDVRTRDWRAERPVPGGHHVLGACAHRQGHLVLLGHRDAGTLHTAVVYEAAVREWVDIGVPPGMVAHAHAVDHGGRAHAIGRGERGGTVLHRRD